MDGWLHRFIYGSNNNRLDVDSNLAPMHEHGYKLLKLLAFKRHYSGMRTGNSFNRSDVCLSVCVYVCQPVNYREELKGYKILLLNFSFIYFFYFSPSLFIRKTKKKNMKATIHTGNQATVPNITES